MSWSYEQLPIHDHLDATLVLKNYSELATDWWLAITDVVASTQAIEAGRYREVNALGGSTIAAVLNAIKPIKVPYVFGGDGASFCFPSSHYAQIRDALLACQTLAREDLGLTLRVGLIPYADIRAQHRVLLCRYRASDKLEQCFFLGGGMRYADQLMRVEPRYQLNEPTQRGVADFSGFQCRWQEVPSPKGVTFSLIVDIRQPSQLSYQQLVAKLNHFLGDDQQHHPLRESLLHLSLNYRKMHTEIASMAQGKPKWVYGLVYLRLVLQTLIGNVLMFWGVRLGKANWGRYKRDTVLNSDYQKIDDAYRTVMSGTDKQVEQLGAWLESGYQQGILYYGLHCTNAAMLTCLVSESGVSHIHFVDAANGGYAMASKQLKQQK